MKTATPESLPPLVIADAGPLIDWSASGLTVEHLRRAKDMLAANDAPDSLDHLEGKPVEVLAPKEPRTFYVATWWNAPLPADFEADAERMFRRTERDRNIKFGPMRRDFKEERRMMESWRQKPDEIAIVFAADVIEEKA